MNDPAEIPRLRAALRAHYEQWHQLTEAEGIAISSGEWARVESLQRTKQRLQSVLDDARRDLRAACSGHGEVAREIEQEFHAVIVELLDLEHANRQLLATKRSHSAQLREEVGHVIQRLRQLRRAYAPAHSSLWETYT